MNVIYTYVEERSMQEMVEFIKMELVKSGPQWKHAGMNAKKYDPAFSMCTGSKNNVAVAVYTFWNNLVMSK